MRLQQYMVNKGERSQVRNNGHMNDLSRFPTYILQELCIQRRELREYLFKELRLLPAGLEYLHLHGVGILFCRDLNIVAQGGAEFPVGGCGNLHFHQL